MQLNSLVQEALLEIPLDWLLQHVLAFVLLVIIVQHLQLPSLRFLVLLVAIALQAQHLLICALFLDFIVLLSHFRQLFINVHQVLMALIVGL